MHVWAVSLYMKLSSKLKLMSGLKKLGNGIDIFRCILFYFSINPIIFDDMLARRYGNNDDNLFTPLN